MVVNSGVGGAAGEQGSLHRSGTAAYLAVHGLLGRSLTSEPKGFPSSIALETDDAVDDIVCTMADGSVWYIQCKRTAGKNDALRATIDQWMNQNELNPKDRLVLVSKKFTGPLRDIQPVIDTLQGREERQLSNGERKNYQSIIDEIKQRGASADHILKHALFIDKQLETKNDPDRSSAAESLANKIVDWDQGNRAFDALQAFMQHASATRTKTHITDWLRCIEEAGIDVYAEADGPRGAQEKLRQQVLEEYRAAVGRDLDVLDLSYLAEDIGTVPVEDLLGQWSISWYPKDSSPKTVDFWAAVRRYSRFVLAGHPGYGKTEALRQAAARMATDPGAPLPIRTTVQRLMREVERSEDVSLDLVLHSAARLVSKRDPALVRQALRTEIFSGSTVFIVDGIDEAMKKRGVVAEGIRRLFEELPPETGLIVSTRPSSRDALAQMDLPVVELNAPQNLVRSLDSVLIETAKVYTETAERQEWLRERRELLQRSMGDTDGIWEVPLLAVLATLRMAKGKESLESSSGILRATIQDSIDRWEKEKTYFSSEIDPQVKPEMLRDGFVAIGKLLNRSSEVFLRDIESKLHEMLKQWESMPARIDLFAQQIISFWDDRVGIFLVDGDRMVPRNRQFAEIAEAQAVSAFSDETKGAWIKEALLDPDFEHTVRLSTEGDRELQRLLLEQAQNNNDRTQRSLAVQWAIDMWEIWSPWDEQLVRYAFEVVSSAATDQVEQFIDNENTFIRSFYQSQRQIDGPGWHCVLWFLRATVPDNLEAERVSSALSIPLPPDRSHLVSLILTLKAAINTGLTAAETEEAEHYLLNNLTIRPERSTTDDDFRGAKPITSVSGAEDFIKLISEFATELDTRTHTEIYRLARLTSQQTYDSIKTILESNQIFDSQPPAPTTDLLKLSAKIDEDYSGFGPVLRNLSATLHEHRGPSSLEDWRCEQLSVFLWGLGYRWAYPSDLQSLALTDQRDLSTWFGAIIHTHGIDKNRLAAEVEMVLSENSSIWLQVARAPFFVEPERRHVIAFTEAEQLVRLFEGSSLMRMNSVALILAQGTEPRLAAIIRSYQHLWSGKAQLLSTIVALRNARLEAGELEDSVKVFLEGNSAQRSGLSAVICSLPGNWQSTKEQLRNDSDGTVRFYLSVPLAGVNYWTCLRCFTESDMSEISCSECDLLAEWSDVSAIS